MGIPMDILDIARGVAPAVPWQGETKIPWDEPGFSARMLREHLDQGHDAASRRFEVVDRHVAWIHDELLGGRAGRVLDLGCGPGFYSSRLARLGHECAGIDFSPASVEYARAEADRDGLSCTYTQGDIRQVDYGDGFGGIEFLPCLPGSQPDGNLSAVTVRAVAQP